MSVISEFSEKLLRPKEVCQRLASATPPYPGGLEKEGSELLELPMANIEFPRVRLEELLKVCLLAKRLERSCMSA